MRKGWMVLGMVLLSACAPVGMQEGGPALPVYQALEPGVAMSPAVARSTFNSVVRKVQPVAERLCNERTSGVSCDFQISIDDRPGQPANAFQSLDAQGRPVIGFTLALVNDARNADELAFVLGHETAHHIAGHLGRQQTTAMAGAMIGGLIGAMGGLDASTVDQLSQAGAGLGARGYSKSHELEADELGTDITIQAGFDPVRGAAFFTRLPDPGDRFLGTHPASGQRIDVVRRRAAQIRGY